MTTDARTSLGRLGEQLAAEHFERLGWRDPRAQPPHAVRRARPRRRRRRRARVLRGQDVSGSAAAMPWDSLHAQKRTQVRRIASIWLSQVRPRPFFDDAAVRRGRASCSTRATASSASTTSRGRSDARHLSSVRVRGVERVRRRRRRGAAGLGRGRPPARAAAVRGRRAGRQGRAGGARARAGGARQLGLRVPAGADHGQPRARRTCARSARASTSPLALAILAASGQLAPRVASRAAPSPASCRSPARCASIRGALAIAEGARRARADPAGRAAQPCTRGGAGAGARGPRRRATSRRPSRSCAASAQPAPPPARPPSRRPSPTSRI